EKLGQKEQYSGIEYYKVDVDAQDQIAQEVGVRAMPTFIAFKNGEKIGSTVGANPTGLEVCPFRLDAPTSLTGPQKLLQEVVAA
ncbi:hypothetical protein HDZ31DRAFT_51272, partial [Schizophyllum fasciatum]